MDDKEYEALACSTLSWFCRNCGMSNFSFSSSFFDSFTLQDDNSFSPIKNVDCHSPLPLDVPLKSPFLPKGASTPPKNLNTQENPKIKNITNGSRDTTAPITKNTVTSLNINFQRYMPKRDIFLNLLNSNPVEIIFGTETWLTDNILNAELNLIDYDIYRRDREDREGGGIMISIKKKFKSTLICKGKFSETIFVKIPIPNKPPIILICVYRTPDLPLDQCQNLCQEIREVQSKFKKSSIWIAGDFNLPDIDWKMFAIIAKKRLQYSRFINQLFFRLKL